MGRQMRPLNQSSPGHILRAIPSRCGEGSGSNEGDGANISDSLSSIPFRSLPINPNIRQELRPVMDIFGMHFAWMHQPERDRNRLQRFGAEGGNFLWNNLVTSYDQVCSVTSGETRL